MIPVDGATEALSELDSCCTELSSSRSSKTVFRAAVLHTGHTTSRILTVHFPILSWLRTAWVMASVVFVSLSA